ncbi:MAG: hypothetical protein PHR61_03170 [Candidatus Absconditabacteria bacterium]|nr:hypothetical protein [Candidatus Absconditabacteria bacterium]
MKNIKGNIFGLFLFIIISINISFAQTCPFGVTNDPYPGQCGRYTDQDQNGFCDFGQTTIEKQGEIDENNIKEQTIDNEETKPIIIFLLIRTITLTLTYIISQTLGKKTFFHRLFCCLDSNITLLLIPLFAFFWFLQVQSPVQYGAARGYGALRGLWLLLISRPLLNILQKTTYKNTILTKFLLWFVCHRKQFGIIMFWLAAVHSFLYLNIWYNYNTLRSNLLTYAGITGFLALLTSFIGYITSNRRSLCNLKSYRKLIQKLAYIGLIATVIHIYIINPQSGIIFGALTIIWAILRFLARRK